MAVCGMNFISMIGPIKRMDELVNLCGESGIFQPDNVFSFYSNTDNFVPILEENPYSAPLAALKNSIYSCGGKIKDVDISHFQVSRSKVDKYINYFSSTIENLMDEKRKTHKELAEYKEEIEKLKHFYGLGKSLKDILSCEYIKARFGKMPKSGYEKYAEAVKKSKENGINLMFFAYDSDSNNQWGFYFADIENLSEIDRIFSGMHFQEIEMKPYDATPYEQAATFRKQRTELYKKIEQTEKEIESFWNSQSNKCMQFYKKLKELNTYFDIKSYAAKYNESFILVGWVPKESADAFKKQVLTLKGMECSFDEGKNLLENSPPVKLKNKKIFRPFEFFVDTYGVPSYNEMDPTAFVAITYTVLFGIMFADLGQGLMVSIAGWLMWKLKKMKLGKILIPCGISSAVFGTIFGSVFGFEHALDPFYKNVFGLSEKPIEVMSSSMAGMIIYTAVGLGIGLLMVSMILGVYSMIKKSDFGEAIFGANGLCGLVFYGSAVFMMLDMIAIHSGAVNMLYILGLLIVPLVLIMFKEILIKLMEKSPDWKPESWGDYIAQSFFELFEVVLSYVTNTMSFLRVGAFVLVHAGMMMVVFTIAQMFGNVGYVITMIVGNIFVIALEALLAGIQVLRLEFYEMFSKFFEGQGRPFCPVISKETIN